MRYLFGILTTICAGAFCLLVYHELINPELNWGLMIMGIVFIILFGTLTILFMFPTKGTPII